MPIVGRIFPTVRHLSLLGVKMRQTILSAVAVACVIWVSPVIGQTKIVEPDWVFEDDFEGGEDGSVWGSSTRISYGVACSSDSNYSSKVLQFNYQGDPDNSFSEKRFAFPASTQVEISYRFFVPANYTHKAPGGNNKLFALWSGSYGVAASNISILSEYNRSSTGQAGSHPDLYIGEDGNNYGHTSYFDQSGDRIFLENDGAWHNMHIYVELAEQEGAYGKAEIWLDNRLILSNEWPLDVQYDAKGVPSSQQIAYSTRGNFLDQGYIFGWANSGFDEETVFCVDDFVLKTRDSLGLSSQTSPSMPPSGLRATKQ